MASGKLLTSIGPWMNNEEKLPALLKAIDIYVKSTESTLDTEVAHVELTKADADVLLGMIILAEDLLNDHDQLSMDVAIITMQRVLLQKRILECNDNNKIVLEYTNTHDVELLYWIWELFS